MFGRNERLLIDVGNSFVHWRLAQQAGQFSSRSEEEALPSDFQAALSVCRCVIAVSVGRSERMASLRALAPAGLPWYQVQRFPHHLLSSAYDTQKLGCDRWVGMLGWLGHAKDASKALVIDAGTAVTLDLLDGTRHEGGWIMPGYQTWFDSLLNNTQMRFTPPDQPQLLSGTDTTTAVANAWLESVVGIVERYRKQNDKVAIVLTGGDAARILAATQGALAIPGLVFDGLHYWYEHTELEELCAG